MAARAVATATDNVTSDEAIGDSSYEQLRNDAGTAVPEVQYSRLNPATRGRQSAAPSGRHPSNQATVSQRTVGSAYEEVRNDHAT